MPTLHNIKGKTKSKYNKPTSTFNYQSSTWRKARNSYIARNPLCKSCLDNNRTTPGNVVDHIIGIKSGGAELNENNFQTLCTKCHAIKSAGERG